MCEYVKGERSDQSLTLNKLLAKGRRAATVPLALLGVLASVTAVRAVPYDVRDVGSSYYGQAANYFCGVATAQMILGSGTVNLNPLPTQQDLFTQVVSKNPGTYSGAPPAPSGKEYSSNGSYYTNPAGLQGTLAARDPGRTYVNYNLADLNLANRTLAYNVDHYAVPGGALINSGGHWVTVVGVNSNVKPALAGPDANFTVNGFYVRDPWSGFAPGTGLGKNAYLATAGTNALWTRLFTPTNFGGTWQGKYNFVTDPDPATDTSNSLAPAPGPIPGGVDAALAASLATAAIAEVSGLASDASFQNGSFSGALLEYLLNGSNEWVVPYYQTGSDAVSAVALIDAVTGALDGAYWDEGVLTGNSLDFFLNYMKAENTGNGTAFPDNPITDNIAPVPEPSTVLLICAGLLALLGNRRMRSRRP